MLETPPTARLHSSRAIPTTGRRPVTFPSQPAERPAPTDEALVARVLAGETHRYEALIARYERPIVNFIHRMIGDREQALDLAQEVFFKAYRSLGRFDPSYRFSTWLYRIASNRSIDHLRRQTPPLVSLEEGADPDRGAPGPRQLRSTAQDPEGVLATRELGVRIARAIEALPVRYRELVLLRHQQGLSYEEIARLRRLPLGTVKNRLFRAREFLKKRLEP